jgi:hypothetical protein
MIATSGVASNRARIADAAASTDSATCADDAPERPATNSGGALITFIP